MAVGNWVLTDITSLSVYAVGKDEKGHQAGLPRRSEP